MPSEASEQTANDLEAMFIGSTSASPNSEPSSEESETSQSTDDSVQPEEVTSESDVEQEPETEREDSTSAEQTSIEPQEKSKSPELSVTDPVQVRKRDFTGLTTEEAALGKKMSNDAFSYFKRLCLEKAQTPASLPVHDHTQAPEWAGLVQEKANLDQELQFWTEQYTKVKNSEDWDNLVRDRQGNYTTQKVAASPQAEAFLIRKMQEANQLVREVNNDMMNVQKTYTGRMDGIKNGVKSLEEKMFGFMEKNPDRFNPELQKTFAMLPKELHSNLLAPGLVKALVTIQALHSELNALKSTKGRLTVEAKRSSPPSSAPIGSGAKSMESLSADELEKMMTTR